MKSLMPLAEFYLVEVKLIFQLSLFLSYFYALLYVFLQFFFYTLFNKTRLKCDVHGCSAETGQYKEHEHIISRLTGKGRAQGLGRGSIPYSVRVVLLFTVDWTNTRQKDVGNCAS